ncbi:TIR domain-containing protein [Portibacter marinus]|uniref:TIR domain-containing protein n=1 Tax=Portibacter marinus TaxID=2898660 RepID=UPI001F182D46|nr:TIR domain-containing protein [Portibacter marinus]
MQAPEWKTRIEKEKDERTGILNLGNCGLTEIPEELFQMIWLQEIVLSNNYEKVDNRWVPSKKISSGFKNTIAKVPELRNASSLRNFRKLTTLSLAGCFDMKLAIDNEVQQLAKLLPPTLIHLDLSHNSIHEISKDFGIGALQYFNLSNNNLKQITFQRNFPNLRELLLSNNKLETLDLPFNNMVTKVSLDGNQLESLNDINLPNSIQILDLQHNLLKNVDFDKLPLRLLHLNLSRNLLSDYIEITKLVSLSTIDLSNNSLTTIPNFSKTQLKKVKLSNNNISNLDFSSPPYYTHLELAGNQVSSIAGLENHSQLEYVDLSDNKISESDLKNDREVIASLRKKKSNKFTLLIHENPFIYNLRNIKEEDYNLKFTSNHLNTFIADFDNFIADKETELENYYLPNKIVLLGNSNAGKTSLTSFLKERKKQKVGQKLKSTEGLQIHYWKDNKNSEFIIYDFGGQDFYHSTYQLFFTNDATFIIVWAADSDENKINLNTDEARPEAYYNFDHKFWIGNVEYILEQSSNDSDPKIFTDNILCVENKIDLNVSEYITKFSFGGIEHFKVSLVSDRRIDKERCNWLRKYILYSHNNSFEDVPTFSGAVKDYLNAWEEMRTEKNKWSVSEWRRWMKKKSRNWGLLNQDQNRKIINRLIYAGLIIHYPHLKGLETTLWVDPEEFRSDINSILNSNEIKDAKGSLNKKQAYELKHFRDYKAVLEKHWLVFEDSINDNEIRYIFPQSLPLNFDKNVLFNLSILDLNFAFSISFDEFMPLGIMNRVITNLGRIAESKFYGRYDIVLNYEGYKIHIKCNFENLTIYVFAGTTSEAILEEIFKNLLYAYHHQASDVGNLLNENHFKIPSDLKVCIEEGFEVAYRDIEEAARDNIHNVIGTKAGSKKKSFPLYKFSHFLADKISPPLKVFISYSHDDYQFREELQKFLVGMERENKIEVWQDGRIQAGMDWDSEIKKNLDDSDIIILLVSQRFIASNYIHEVELKRAINTIGDDERHLIPVLIKNADYENWIYPVKKKTNLTASDIKLGNFQFLPVDDKSRKLKAVNKYQYQEDAWKQVVQKIREIIDLKQL